MTFWQEIRHDTYLVLKKQIFHLWMEMIGPDGRSDDNLTAEITFPGLSYWWRRGFFFFFEFSKLPIHLPIHSFVQLDCVNSMKNSNQRKNVLNKFIFNDI